MFLYLPLLFGILTELEISMFLLYLFLLLFIITCLISVVKLKFATNHKIVFNICFNLLDILFISML